MSLTSYRAAPPRVIRFAAVVLEAERTALAALCVGLGRCCDEKI